MMLFTQVTRCPHCHTSFRVSDEHLEAAAGVVRCGSCLQVFKATEHLVNESEPAAPLADTTSIDPASIVTATTASSAIRFMPETDHDPAPATESPLAFTFADEPDTDSSDVINDSVSDELEPAKAESPEPELVEPEPDNETVETVATSKPSASKLQEHPEFDQFSARKTAQRKAALASHLIDLSADDEDELDIDLDGELLISDEGIMPLEDTETVSSDNRYNDLHDNKTEPELTADLTRNSDTSDLADLKARNSNENVSDIKDDLSTDYQSTDITFANSEFADIESSDAPEPLNHLKPELNILETQPANAELSDVKEEVPNTDIVEFELDITPEDDSSHDEFPMDLEFTHNDIDLTADSAETHSDDLSSDLDFSFTESDNSDTDAINPENNAEDAFAGLLDDAMAEAAPHGSAASLDDLLDEAETVSTQQITQKPSSPAPENNDTENLEDSLRFHDDMEGVDKLAELLGEEATKPKEADPLTANLSNMVSDDYNDIMSNLNTEVHDDTAYEDKWALELLGSDEQKKPTRYHDDIEGPDLNSIEEFENSGAISFSDIHEQNRTSSISSKDLDTDTAFDNLENTDTIDNTANADGYVDTYVDEYVDDTLDDTQDDTLNDSSPKALFEDNDDEEISYNERLPGSNDFNKEYAKAFDSTEEGKVIGSHIGLSREVEITIPKMAMEPIALEDEKPQSTHLIWSLAALLLILAATVQIGIFRFESASRSETWRPMYEQICGVFGCNLPSIQNVKLIRASNTVFNQHRTNTTVIVVDTLLTNTADYPQPYPDIELEFRDLNGQIVAQRTFAPSHYLAGDVLPGDSMPSDIPVHIALDLVNPGPEAVSRQIFIRPNQ